MGNMACCRDENCARGRALYATGPAMKDFYFSSSWSKSVWQGGGGRAHLENRRAKKDAIAMDVRWRADP